MVRHQFRRTSGRVQEELEFKNSSTWSTTLGLQHVYLPVCGRKNWVTSTRHIAVCLLAKDLMKLLNICTCVFLICDILEYVYPSACDKKFSVQLDPYLVQRKYKFRNYISKLITTQSSSPYKVVLVSTSSWIAWVSNHTFFGLPNRTLPFVFSGETVRLCMGESEKPNVRLRSHLELWSRSWHSWFLEQSFQVRKLFYNDTFVDVLFRGLDSDRKSSRSLPNTSTFVPNDRSQCLHCVLPSCGAPLALT